MKSNCFSLVGLLVLVLGSSASAEILYRDSPSLAGGTYVSSTTLVSSAGYNGAHYQRGSPAQTINQWHTLPWGYNPTEWGGNDSNIAYYGWAGIDPGREWKVYITWPENPSWSAAETKHEWVVQKLVNGNWTFVVSGSYNVNAAPSADEIYGGRPFKLLYTFAAGQLAEGQCRLMVRPGGSGGWVYPRHDCAALSSLNPGIPAPSPNYAARPLWYTSDSTYRKFRWGAVPINGASMVTNPKPIMPSLEGFGTANQQALTMAVDGDGDGVREGQLVLTAGRNGAVAVSTYYLPVNPFNSVAGVSVDAIELEELPGGWVQWCLEHCDVTDTNSGFGTLGTAYGGGSIYFSQTDRDAYRAFLQHFKDSWFGVRDHFVDVIPPAVGGTTYVVPGGEGSSVDFGPLTNHTVESNLDPLTIFDDIKGRGRFTEYREFGEDMVERLEDAGPTSFSFSWPVGQKLAAAGLGGIVPSDWTIEFSESLGETVSPAAWSAYDAARVTVRTLLLIGVTWVVLQWSWSAVLEGSR